MLHTPRLEIIPLNPEELEKIATGSDNLGSPHSTILEDHPLAEALKNDILPAVRKDPQNFLWYTVWIIHLKESKKTAGSCGFKGPAGKDGWVEVGFGILPAFRCLGYMTEALKELISWALKQPGIYGITASIHKDNLPSIRVLEKAGLIRGNLHDDHIFWIKRR